MTNVVNIASTIAIGIVSAALVAIAWQYLRKRRYASAVYSAVSSSAEGQALQEIVHQMSEERRIELSIVQLQVLKYSFSARLLPQVAADTMLVAISDFVEQVDADTD